MGIKFSDIIALAKSGYSVADVKELMQLSETPSNDAPKAQQDDQEPAAEDPEEEEEVEEEPDYKKLYEEEAERVRKLQRENINKNAQQPKEKTDQEILMDMARDFM